MFTLEDIAQRLEALEQSVLDVHTQLADLYLPKPLAAENDRPRRPIKSEPLKRQAILRQDPTGIYKGDELWASKSLETGGFSHQNAFVALTVYQDTIPSGLGWQPMFVVELQGACGSPWAVLDSAVIVSGGMTGVFTTPVLRGTSSSLEIRVVLFGADNVKWTPPPPGRVITYSVEGVLIAGYEM